MDPITIHIREDVGISRQAEPICLGIPFPRGALFPAQAHLLQLSIPAVKAVIPFEASVLTEWPDDSVRWLSLKFLATLPSGEEQVLRLAPASSLSSARPEPANVEYKPDGALLITTKAMQLHFASGRVQWTQTAILGTNGADSAKPVHHALRGQSVLGEAFEVKLNGFWQVIENNAVAVIVESTGNLNVANEKPLAGFRCRLEIFHNSPNQKIEISLHNPNRACHPGGLWDLGDIGSVHFRSLELAITASDAGTPWLQADRGLQPSVANEGEKLNVYQDSSGGDSWQSLNHVDAEGHPIPRFRGYRMTRNQHEIGSGDRAQPVGGVRLGNHNIQATLSNFWQNFPSSISADARSLMIGLFPADATEPYELQGGERKTQTIWLSTSADTSALDWVRWPLRPILDPHQYQASAAIPWFESDSVPTALETLIREGVKGPNNFFNKREIIDEYGWRNFGDLFADHETLYQAPGETPLVSHYNNQYDAIYGFARQYALTGDRRWFELMDDLAEHVKDIDIYHTSGDRAEYNNGLFWHTDHYLPAHTATHRTFSRHNGTSSTPGQTGGGPAAEHCYTTGLLYHYYLTGSGTSRQAVLELAGWMKAIHEGEGGLLEQLLALKKQDLPGVRALIRGERPMAHTYPFTRGTGNYLNTLLDAWQLEPDKGWLKLAERVIRHTIHPADDISKRKLLDVETGWSYVVMLSSIARYLWLKTQNNDPDEHYHFARQSFLHYTDWMLGHERPFLENTDQLEFPNDTWTAQDIRKAMLFYQAATLAEPESADEYRRQADHWLTNVCDRLAESPERHFTRILIILLQNHGPHQVQPTTTYNCGFEAADQRPPTLTWFALASRIIVRLSRGLLNFRPSREKAWLNARLNR